MCAMLFPIPPITSSIGIWGATKSGKTTYLTALQPAFNRLREQNNVDLHWLFTPVNQNARDFIEKHVGEFAHGILPGATDVAAPELLEFRLEHPTARAISLHMMDAAGGLTEDVHDDYGYFRLLSSCSGILLMLDCMSTGRQEKKATGQRIQLLRDMLLQYQPSQTAKIAVAVCITQVDRHPEWESIVNNPRQYLTDELVPRGSYSALCGITAAVDADELDDICPVSVLGHVRTFHGIRWNVKQDKPESRAVYRIPDMAHWEPFNLLRPLFYLIRHIRRTQGRLL